eukprot:scaffold22884_cov66-Phaeocystis_antarctica.AAC.8
MREAGAAGEVGGCLLPLPPSIEAEPARALHLRPRILRQRIARVEPRHEAREHVLAAQRCEVQVRLRPTVWRRPGAPLALAAWSTLASQRTAARLSARRAAGRAAEELPHLHEQQAREHSDQPIQPPDMPTLRAQANGPPRPTVGPVCCAFRLLRRSGAGPTLGCHRAHAQFRAALATSVLSERVSAAAPVSSSCRRRQARDRGCKATGQYKPACAGLRSAWRESTATSSLPSLLPTFAPAALQLGYCNVEVVGGGGHCGARDARLARPRWRVVVGWTLHPRRRVGGGWGDV